MATKIYTKTGDTGQTSLFGGARLSKSHIRIEAYGTTDELNAIIGLLLDQEGLQKHKDILLEIQNRLFTIGSNLASDPSKEMITPDLEDADLKLLENSIDEMQKELPALKNFILPGGHQSVSFCHLARTVSRRAERRVVALATDSEVDEKIIVYLNRLSDYFFVLGRTVANSLGVEETKWVPKEKSL